MRIFLSILLLINILFANVLTLDQIESRIKKINGDTTEYLMHKTFKKNGWKQIEGEIGGNGIDGLYIKKNSQGIIMQVMFGEAKYNTSQLGTNYYGTNTKNVKQMSKIALINQIDNLIKKHPRNREYIQIKQHITHNNYRVRLFQLKKEGTFLIPIIKEIKHNDNISIEKKQLTSNLNYKINNNKININNPQNILEAQFIKNYKRAQINGLIKKFNFSAVESQNLINKNPILTQNSLTQNINSINSLKIQIKQYFQTKEIDLKSENLKLKTKTFWKKIKSKSFRFLK
jgi:hypothetical protein